MSVAVLYGASSGIGLHLARHILTNTNLSVVALSSRQPSHTSSNILDALSSKDKALADRLSVFQVDGLAPVDQVDRAFEDAAKGVVDRFGKSKVRLVGCLAGILHPEKSITQIDPVKALESFQLNTLSHLLAYKHFAPLIPTLRQLSSAPSGDDDPARGLFHEGTSLCLSVSARVGSVRDNRMGGWVSYRSSKTALNQVIKTLALELNQRKSSAVALSYHPGTTKTPLSSPFVSPSASSRPEEGLFEPEVAVEKLVRVMGGLKGGLESAGGDSGGFRDWKGERVQW